MKSEPRARVEHVMLTTVKRQNTLEQGEQLMGRDRHDLGRLAKSEAIASRSWLLK